MIAPTNLLTKDIEPLPSFIENRVGIIDQLYETEFIAGIPVDYIRNENGCKLCTNRALDRKGYGRICVRGENTRVHRATYEYHNNIILPRHLQIRHLCHNPRCFEITHLAVGTAMDNKNDQILAGRMLQGEQVKSHKLTEEIVLYIINSTESNKALAKIFNVRPSTIRDVRQGRSWKYIYSNKDDNLLGSSYILFDHEYKSAS